MATQTQMPIFMGLAAGLNASGQIGNIAATIRTVAKTASYTAKAEESGTWFTNTGASGAVTITLPAPAAAVAGVYYLFTATAAQSFAVASGTADTMVTDGDAAADSLTASTASHIIGATLLVVCDGSLWLTFAAGNGSAVWTAAS